MSSTSAQHAFRNLASRSRASRATTMLALAARRTTTAATGRTRIWAPIGGVSVAASFGTDAVRLAAKESSLGKEDRADEVERAKQEQLREQKEGKGQWKDELASESESIVKADRGEFNASKETIEKLQKETEKMAKKSG